MTYRRPEILRVTVANVLRATSEVEPTMAEVTRRHQEINNEIERLARSYSEPGEEPTPQIWELAYSQVLETEINDPMRQVDDPNDPEEWIITPEIKARIEAELEAQDKMLDSMTEEQQQEWWDKENTRLQKVLLRSWLKRQGQLEFEDKEILDRSVEVLWAQIQADPTSDPRLKE